MKLKSSKSSKDAGPKKSSSMHKHGSSSSLHSSSSGSRLSKRGSVSAGSAPLTGGKAASKTPTPAPASTTATLSGATAAKAATPLAGKAATTPTTAKPTTASNRSTPTSPAPPRSSSSLQAPATEEPPPRASPSFMNANTQPERSFDPKDITANRLSQAYWMVNPDLTAHYETQGMKGDYARRVRPGQGVGSMPTFPNVQRATTPVRRADSGLMINDNLPQDMPQLSCAFMPPSAMAFNVNRNSFAGNPFVASSNSLYGGMSMYNPGGTSLYNNNPYARPTIGSMFGPGMMGNGSMYGPMDMGSMYAQHISTMYGYQPMSRLASLYSSSNQGSLYGGAPGSMYGSMYTGSMYGMPTGPVGSMYGFGGSGKFASQNVMLGGNSMYAQQGGPGSLYGQQAVNNSLYGPGSIRLGRSNSMGSRSMQGHPIAAPLPGGGMNGSGARLGGLAAGGRLAAGSSRVVVRDSGRQPNIDTVIALLPTSHTNTTVMYDESNSFLQLRKDTTVRSTAHVILCEGEDEGKQKAWLKSPEFGGLLDLIRVGHNGGLLIACGSSSTERQLARHMLMSSVDEILRSLKIAHLSVSDTPISHYDVQLYAFSLRNASEAVDVVADGAGGEHKTLQVGTNAIFGPAPINMKYILVSPKDEHQSSVTRALKDVCDSDLAHDAPLQVVELVIKQVRKAKPTMKNGKSVTKGPDTVLLSSVIILLNTGHKNATAYFGAMRDPLIATPALLKNVIGGPCGTTAILCLSPMIDTADAATAMRSLNAIHAVANTPPRSGNVRRFAEYANNELTKLKKEKANPLALRKLQSLVRDCEDMLHHPSEKTPALNPVAGKKSQVAVEETLKQRQEAARGGTPRSLGGGGSSTGGGSSGAIAPAADRRSPALAHAPGANGNSNEPNPVRLSVIASPTLVAGDTSATFVFAPETLTLTDEATGAQCAVHELLLRNPADPHEVVTASRMVPELRNKFANGTNTALIGTVSPREMWPLEAQPLWLVYQNVLYSFLKAPPKMYSFVEIGLSMTVLIGGDVATDLLAASKTDSQPHKLTAAFSPLFGPIVYRAATMKLQSADRLTATIQAALQYVPEVMRQYPLQHAIIYASAVMKAVAGDDVTVSSFIAASTTSPALLLNVMARQPNTPCELFDYAFGGPCHTLFLADVLQGDEESGNLVQLINRLNVAPNRSPRSCSVQRFLAFAEDSLKRSAARLANAQTKDEKEAIEKSRRSMDIFFTEYKALLGDPKGHEPKVYRKNSV